jgi:hypothetical protein
MSNWFHYDKKGNYEGHSSKTPPGGEFIILFLAVLAGLWYFFPKFTNTLSNYSSYESPHHIIYGFYYYLLIFPFSVFSSILTNDITQYPNLNLVLGIVFILSIIYVLYKLLSIAMNRINDWKNIDYKNEIKFRRIRMAIISIPFMPAIIGVLHGFVIWLFTQ